MTDAKVTILLHSAPQSRHVPTCLSVVGISLSDVSEIGQCLLDGLRRIDDSRVATLQVHAFDDHKLAKGDVQ